MKLVSLIVPVYNVAPWLPECLESLRRQTYPEAEFILVDDGSTDGSGEICDRFAADDPRFIVCHQRNAGVSAARNNGLRCCKGEYIGFVDGDDWTDPSMIAEMADRLEAENADAVMCRYVSYPQGMDKEAEILPTKSAETCDAAQALLWIMRRNGYFTALWNKMFRRESIMADGQIISMNETIALGEDEIWLMTVLPRCGKICFTDEALYYWRPRNDSACRVQQVTDRTLTLLSAKKTAISLMDGYGPVHRELARSRMLNDAYYLKINAYATGDLDTCKVLKSEFSPLWRPWFACRDVLRLRKLKVIVLELMMNFRLPVSWVTGLYNVRRSYTAFSSEEIAL